MNAAALLLVWVTAQPVPAIAPTPPESAIVVGAPAMPPVVLPNGAAWPTGLGPQGPAWGRWHCYRHLGTLYHDGGSYNFRRSYDYPWSMPTAWELGYFRPVAPPPRPMP